MCWKLKVSITLQLLAQLMAQRSNPAKNWVFTLNNFTEDELKQLQETEEPWIRYLVFQHERGSEGTDHLQGYLECVERRRLPQLRRFLPRAHWEIRRGNQSQAIRYATKEDSRIAGPWTVGLPFSSSQGRRTDLDELASRLYQGATVEEIREHFPGHSLRYKRQIAEAARERRQSQFGKRPRPDLEVYVFWGDPGTGKTRSVYESEGFDRVYTLNTATNGHVWFDGYDGEPVLLIDDFRGWIRFNEFLKILDIYPLRLPIKGSYDFAAWTRVYITSNHCPEDWWKEESGHCLAALRRRFTRVEHFSADHPWLPGAPFRGGEVTAVSTGDTGDAPSPEQ